MRKEDCLLDTIVALNATTATTAPLRRGKVVGFGASEIVLVEWPGGTISKASMRNLLTEQEADIKEAKLLAKEAELNREFNEASKQIKDKLTTASNLIIEASKLAAKNHTDLQSMYDECRPLMQALDNAGWSTSSMSC
jgi:hypothetical protein